MDKTVFDVFKEKHPEPGVNVEEAFLECDDLPSLIDVDVTAGHVEKAARKLSGGAGPSGTDSDNWRAFLLRYGNASLRLREAIAASIRMHANQIVDWKQIRGILGRRGVALNKCPGVRPIGIGEMEQRIEAKVMADVTGFEAQEASGVDNLCAGLKAGIEGGIHSMHQIFEDDNSEACLLVDASNAFNAMSREAALWNCRVLWPSCSRFLFNTYRGYARIFMKGSPEILLSKEGTTQGDSLAMLMYGHDNNAHLSRFFMSLNLVM